MSTDLNITNGISKHELWYKLQKKDPHKYFFTIYGCIYWEDSIKRVKDNIFELVNVYNIEKGYKIRCYVTIDNIITLVNMYIYSDELIDYLDKNLVIHDNYMEMDVIDKQKEDPEFIYAVVYLGLGFIIKSPMSVKEKIKTFDDVVYFRRLKGRVGDTIRIEGIYRGIESLMVFSYNKLISLSKIKENKLN